MENNHYELNKTDMIKQVNNLNLSSDVSNESELLLDMSSGPLMIFIEEIAQSFVANTNEYSIDKIINRTIDTVQFILSNGKPNNKTVLNNKQILHQVIVRLTDVLSNHNVYKRNSRFDKLDNIHKRFSIQNQDNVRIAPKCILENLPKDPMNWNMDEYKCHIKPYSKESDDQIQLSKPKKLLTDGSRALIRRDGFSRLSYLDYYPERYTMNTLINNDIHELAQNEYRKEIREFSSYDYYDTAEIHKSLEKLLTSRPLGYHQANHSIETQLASVVEPQKRTRDASEDSKLATDSKVTNDSKLTNEYQFHLNAIPVDILINYVDKLKADINQKFNSQNSRNLPQNSLHIISKTGKSDAKIDNLTMKIDKTRIKQDSFNDNLPKFAIKNDKNSVNTDDYDDDDDNTEELLRVCKKYLRKRNNKLCKNFIDAKDCYKTSTRNCLDKTIPFIYNEKRCAACNHVLSNNPQYVLCKQHSNDNKVDHKTCCQNNSTKYPNNISSCIPIIKNDCNTCENFKSQQTMSQIQNDQNNYDHITETSLVNLSNNDDQNRNQQNYDPQSNFNRTSITSSRNDGIIKSEQLDIKNIVKYRLSLVDQTELMKLSTDNTNVNKKSEFAKPEIPNDGLKTSKNSQETEHFDENSNFQQKNHKRLSFSIRNRNSSDDNEIMDKIPSTISPSITELISQYTYNIVTNKHTKYDTDNSLLKSISNFSHEKSLENDQSKNLVKNDSQQIINASSIDNNKKIETNFIDNFNKESGKIETIKSNDFNDINDTNLIENNQQVCDQNAENTNQECKSKVSQFSNIDTRSKSPVPSVLTNVNTLELSNSDIIINEFLNDKPNQKPVGNDSNSSSEIVPKNKSDKFIQYDQVKSMPQTNKDTLNKSVKMHALNDSCTDTDDDDDDDDDDDSDYCNMGSTLLPINCYCTNCISTLLNPLHHQFCPYFQQKTNMGYYSHDICSQQNRQIPHQQTSCCCLTHQLKDRTFNSFC